MHEHPVFAFGSEVADAVAQLSPILATFAGVRGHDHRWDDLGPAGLAARAARYAELDRALGQLERAHARDGRDVALALRALREHVDEQRAHLASPDPYFDLNHISSSFQMVSMVFDVAPRDGEDAVEAIAARLEALPAALASYQALLQAGLARDARVARRQVQAVITQGRGQLARDHLGELARSLPTTPVLAARLAAGAARSTAALAALVDWLETTYLPSAAVRDAVGRERYARAAVRHLGLSLDLDHTHAWGFAELTRIEREIGRLATRIAGRLGCTPTLVAVSAALDAREGTSLPVPAFLEAMQGRQDDAQRALAAHFDVPEPARRLEVRLAPPGGPVGAYYVAPSEDFVRPGTVWYSPGSATHLPLWREVTTAFHEGFPGHHLQVATQVFLRDRLTRFQRLFADKSGYAEGWALYAEQLMLELGLFASDEEELGMHAAQLVRACRVVIDLGLHLELTIPKDATFHPGERWTPALAVELLTERALLSREKAESEVLRYLGWPAQAITYAVGKREMLRLREARRAREGAAFDLRRFHQDVLATGTVGLSTLAWALEASA